MYRPALANARAHALLVLGVWVGAACGPGGPPLRDHGLLVIARADDHAPLPGVQLWLDGEVAGTTGADGTLETGFRGVDGSRVQVHAECPPGYSEPQFRSQLTLRTFAGLGGVGMEPSDDRLRIQVTCHATQRTVVVAIRTGQAGLPIMRREQMLGRTNPLGAAHVKVTVPRRGRFRLTLETSQRPALRPQSPSKLFELEDGVPYLVWDQPIVPPPPKPRRRVRRVPAYQLQ